MKQDDCWQMHYDEIMHFMEQNHRCPSKHRIEDHRMLNWMKYNRKLVSKGQLPADRLKRFNLLLDTAKKYRHINQYA
ncbi:MAG: hypothetical protein IJ580_03565 [Prevotella sp.]|nr:hypothetical protein [Prevotella sp.]MBR1556554.1 hypothetical protein [Prevotella sp.]MBR1901921.1 hypothetical protein [Bacteroidaceae bacterium]